MVSTTKPTPKQENKTNHVEQKSKQVVSKTTPDVTMEESSDEEVEDGYQAEYNEEEPDEIKELKMFQQMQETIEKKKEEIALYSQTVSDGMKVLITQLLLLKILSSPETNIEKLQRLFVLCHDPTLPSIIHNIALLSIAAVFKDIHKYLNSQVPCRRVQKEKAFIYS